MKFILIILPVVTAIFCTPDDFRFIEISSQRVIPGIRGAGIIHNYFIKYIPGRSKNGPELIYLWAEGKRLAIKNKKTTGDTLQSVASFRMPGEREPGYENPVFDTTPPPVFFNGVALIHYRIKEKNRYYAVNAIKKLPVIPLP
ncbi:MAG: hypothetical protein HYY40_04560 [Bacteroidetes bacterium]|nr:hypothetical protein [Bacteroidota bacterium]